MGVVSNAARPIIKTVFFVLVLVLVFCLSVAIADEANYLYDNTGRLDRVVKGTDGLKYQYDSEGNLLSINRSSISAAQPVLQSIAPNVLFIGQKTLATITGLNLFTAKSITFDNPDVSAKILDVTDVNIKAEITVSSSASPRTANITVTTLYGSANISVALSSSKLNFSPGQISMTPGSVRNIDVSVTPSIGQEIVIPLSNSNSPVASAPESVAVPVSGTTFFNVTAIQNGTATISSGDPRTVVFVGPAFYNEPGETTTSYTGVVSMYIDVPLGNSRTQSPVVSAYIDAPLGNSMTYAPIVSVVIAP